LDLPCRQSQLGCADVPGRRPLSRGTYSIDGRVSDSGSGEQVIPWSVRWMDSPHDGNYLAAVGDVKSQRMLRTFLEARPEALPELRVVSLRQLLRGRLVCATRRSDNASFWSCG